MAAPNRRIGLTMGDPSGVGPEIVLKALESLGPNVAANGYSLVVIGTPACIRRTARQLGTDIALVSDEVAAVWPKVPLVAAAETDQDIIPGKMSAEAGRLAYRAIERAVDMAMTGDIDAIVTAPINKEALNAAGFHYVGHTDMLAELTGSPDGCMMLAHDKLRVTHVSTHIPLSQVSKRITPPRVRRVIQLTLGAMHELGIETPRVAVCGLNPHAGESGLLGDEDKAVLEPAIAEFRAAGEEVTGPLPGDTVFVKAAAGQFAAVVAMFHDQGHIPVKLLGFTIDAETGIWTGLGGINVTLGLPIIRTSVDHGTAFDIAGKGVANAQSMIEAIEFAARLARWRWSKAPRQ